jgi:hypothetical protein
MISDRDARMQADVCNSVELSIFETEAPAALHFALQTNLCMHYEYVHYIWMRLRSTFRSACNATLFHYHGMVAGSDCSEEINNLLGQDEGTRDRH